MLLHIHKRITTDFTYCIYINMKYTYYNIFTKKLYERAPKQ